MNILSNAFAAGQPMPARYTADGDNHSPPLTFADVPAKARSLVLMCLDLDAEQLPFVHWLLFNIDPKITGLAQAEIAGRYRDGANGFGELGYVGPFSPEEHVYSFRLYALDTWLDCRNGVDREALEQAMSGHILDQAELTTRFTSVAPQTIPASRLAGRTE